MVPAPSFRLANLPATPLRMPSTNGCPMISSTQSIAHRPPSCLRPVILAAALLLVGAAVLAQDGAIKRGEPVTLNFAGAEIEAVARTLATLSGRNVVVDPRVKGTITLITERPVTPVAAWTQFLSTLRLQGYTVVESGGLYKVVPEAEAKLQTGAVSAGTVPPPGGQVTTQIFRLNHETANNLIPVLRPLISPNNTINVNPGNNSLVITDYADNLQRIARIIAVMDVANATDVEIIPLQHAIASDLAPLVSRLIQSGSAPAVAQGQADTSYKTVVMAETRSNTLIVRAANAAQLALVASLVTKLDQPASGPGGRTSAAGNIHVVYLKNADATKLANTLRAALAGETRSASATVAAAPATTGGVAVSAARTVDNQPSTGGQIQADAATNSLIITAPEPQYRQLRAVIDKLDARRAQVFIESLIAEVNADKSAELSVQWQGPLGQAGSSVIGFLGTNFFSSASGQNIINMAQTAAAGSGVNPGQGVNIAAAKKFNGVYVLGFLANFLQSNGDGNILSTPNLLTLDNEEAKISIGKNVPIVTGQYTSNNNASSGAVNPFQTIERKDVGLTLRVKPQISENGTIKMVIFQEVSSIAPESVASKDGLITNKRSIETSVLVEDGGIVVLGGLLDDTYSSNVDKVPGLGDLPVLGNLFKSESRSRKKTNLMIFLRPVVLRDAQATDNLTMDRYDLMRGAQRDAQPTSRTMVPINQAPILPATRNSLQVTVPEPQQPAPAARPSSPDPSRN